MGGCSSKPKTAECEGSMESHEEKHQDEALRKSLEVEKAGVHAGLKGIDRQQEPSTGSIRSLLTKREQDDVRDMFTVTDKQMIAGFSLEGNSKEKRQLLEHDCQHVKQILAETINDSGAEQALTVKEEILEVQINPEVITSELREDPVLVTEVTKNIQETPTVDIQKEPLTLSEETLENEGKVVFSESETLSLKDICISTAEDAWTLQMKPTGPQNAHVELLKNLSAGGEKISELQKEPFSQEDAALGLEDGHTEASRKGRVESKYHGAFCKNEEQRFDDSVGHEGQDNHFSKGSKEGEELCKETGAGACEVANAASGGVLALERRGKVLKDSSKQIWEAEIKGAEFEEAEEELITGTCIVKNSPFADISDEEPSREIDNTDATHPAMTTCVSLNNLHHVVDEQVLVREVQEVDVDAAYKMVMKDVKPQADSHLVNDLMMKESNVETFNTIHREAELISTKISMDDKGSLPVSEEPLNVQLLLENLSGKVQAEKSYAAVICIDGEQKLNASCTPDEVTASQVTATTKKPEVQSVHVMEFTELALSPAQDIPAPDIDEVLEKLASEFERQESLARANS